MLKIINKIFKYFGYEVQKCETIDIWFLDIDRKAKIIKDKITEISYLKQELSFIENLYQEENKKSKNRYKEVNRLRSNVKSLTESRDRYKNRYKEICWKLALKNVRK